VTDTSALKRWRAPGAATAAALAVTFAACGDDPFDYDWTLSPGALGTVQLYSLARPELSIVSAFNFAPPPSAAVVEAASATRLWDVAIDTQGGQLVLLPPGAMGITAQARVSALGTMDFAEVAEAPADTLLYEDDQPVALAVGDVYVVRTNRQVGSFGSSCVYYAKMQPMTIDVAEGTLVFRYAASPICNSRELVYRN
jgi:hypothetical protein